MLKDPIKTFIIEEHNEAFFIWNYAVNKKIINSEKNILVHVDEHLDMGTPRLYTSIFDLNSDMKAVLDFSYNELSINAFIIPAVFQGIINKIYWIKKI